MFYDKDLQNAVLAELNWEPSVTAAHIGVAVHDGVVTLSGHVSTYAEKQAAASATRRVKGVKAIAEEIKVRLPFDFSRTDDQIGSAIIDRLSWDVTVPQDAVKVLVENGWITLTGEVDWHFQKVAAEQDIHRLMGVVGVSNQITIKPRVNTSNISDDITHALHRSVFFDPKTVFVNADGGAVKLTGTVGSYHDRQVAGRTAWGAIGVTAVENDIAVI